MPKNKRKEEEEEDSSSESDTEYDDFVVEYDDTDDLSNMIYTYLQDFNWKEDLNEEDIKNLQPLYNKICGDIAIVPKISDILKLSMPYNEKCDIIEKILILYNAQPNTFEFLQLKRHLNKTIEKYKHFVLTEEEYEKYTKIEDSLVDTQYKPLKYQILDMDLSLNNKSYIYQRYLYFTTLENSSSEYNKLKNWIDSALLLPTKLKPMNISFSDSNYKINKYLWSVKEALDREIYGLELVKEKIIFMLTNRITNKNSKGLGFAICGPPGTAKTSIIQCLSRAIDLPFFQINLGGAKDVSFLSGHSYTYEGAVPGVIAQAMTTLKYKNGIIYFDEFDKISNTQHGMEISRMLLHITDHTQNDKFHDRYFSNGIDIDLSNVWFVYSLNDTETVDKTLCDRIPILHIEGYTTYEKIEIAKNYLIPKALTNINLEAKSVHFPDDTIKHIIELSNETDKKSGVRQIKHIIDNILMKINLLRTIYNKKESKKESKKERQEKQEKQESKKQKKNSYKLKLTFDIPEFNLPITITREVIKQLKIETKKENDISFGMYM
jgi:ATP-dependent Lon protease